MDKKPGDTGNQKQPSMQMRAVLTIFIADPYLMKIVEPYINLNTETIHWDPIFKSLPSSGHRACAFWAYSIWTDEVRTRANPFDAALNLTPQLHSAILKALSIRWGIFVESEEIQVSKKGA